LEKEAADLQGVKRDKGKRGEKERRRNFKAA